MTSKYLQQLFRQHTRYLRNKIIWTASHKAQELLMYISVLNSSPKKSMQMHTDVGRHTHSLKKVQGVLERKKFFCFSWLGGKKKPNKPKQPQNTHMDLISLLLQRSHCSCTEAQLKHKGRGC